MFKFLKKLFGAKEVVVEPIVITPVIEQPVVVEAVVEKKIKKAKKAVTTKKPRKSTKPTIL
jgi:hypothetical protein